ncbi:hypothetical protein OsI_30672 [Oryza sativa Indica Group]|jgi:hypothetical protein|uniref:Uncharacterized protein n=1 Tax=Oryza sativa subsp. indica TaxID=39946 RepID=B8BDQ1_ORYSI|nr:hypothetical protein OsI_30672 [Oryza sativa Indica Group]
MVPAAAAAPPPAKLMALEGLEAGQYAELGDPRLEGKVVADEVERVIKVGLCCLHEDPQLRPSMAMVAGCWHA